MQKSFTLIELMVVVAIIGLVASIILVSLGDARARARNARILLDLRQVKTIAALIDSTYGSYPANFLCLDETGVTKTGLACGKLSDFDPCLNNVRCRTQ